MGVRRCITFLIEFLLCFGIICLSLVVTITIALLKSDFDGSCPLYPTVRGIIIKFNDVQNCNFIIGMNAATMFIALLVMVYRSVEFCKQKQLIEHAVLPAMITAVFLLVSVLILATACVIAVGFNLLCKDLLRNDPFGYIRCHDVQHWGIRYPFNWSHFHNYLVAAETAALFNFGLCAAMGSLTFIIYFCCKGNCA